MKIPKQIVWVSSSKKDLYKFPKDIIRTMIYGLERASIGERYENAKTLKGFGSASIIEIIDSDASGTYRTMYSIKMQEAVFVLHAFQKKSNQGIKTPKKEMDLVESRIKQAQELYKTLFKAK